MQNATTKQDAKAPARHLRLKPAHAFIAVGLALVVVYAFLGISILNTSGEVQDAQADIAVARGALASSRPSPAQDREARQRDAESRLAAALAAFPESVEGSGFLGGVLDLADAYRVQLTGAQNRQPAKQKVGQTTYTFVPFSLSLQGRRDDLVAFMAALEGITSQALVVRTVQLTQGPKTSVLVLQVELYTRPPEDQPQPAPKEPSTPQPATQGK